MDLWRKRNFFFHGKGLSVIPYPFPLLETTGCLLIYSCHHYSNNWIMLEVVFFRDMICNTESTRDRKKVENIKDKDEDFYVCKFSVGALNTD